MLANTSALYDPASYNNGSVWPFLNGFLSWAEYRNHRAASGFTRWIGNGRLTYLNAAGYVSELLSGDYCQSLDTAVPHQLFSSAGILTPLVKGLLGFYPADQEKLVCLEPHLPVRWGEMEIRNLGVGSGTLPLRHRAPAERHAVLMPAHERGSRAEYVLGSAAGSTGELETQLLLAGPLALP